MVAPTITFGAEMQACPSCGAGRPIPLDYIVDNLAASSAALVSGCESCGLVFVNPPPSADELDAYYRPGGAWDRKLKHRERVLAKKLERLKGQPRRSKTSMITVANALREQTGACRVLDFGCGAGDILDKLQEQGWETAGIDPISADTITRHRMLEAMPATPSYDVVIMKHVLEHIPDPLAVLRAARAAVFDKGHLLVAVPTLDGMLEHGKRGYCINRMQHVTAYTERSLRNLMALAGFAVVERLQNSRTYRMSFLAQATDKPELVQDPLRDARREFHRLAIANEGWGARILAVRVRARRALSRHPGEAQPRASAAGARRTKPLRPSAWGLRKALGRVLGKGRQK
jgi:SAM-dependent methyltransferase